MAQRDQLEVDVLFVGAGPASLAGAIRLGQLAKAAGRELEILVIEKGARDRQPRHFRARWSTRARSTSCCPEWHRRGAPIDAPVGGDELWFLTEGGKIKAPFTPPVLNNHGKYVASLNRSPSGWASRPRPLGAHVFRRFPAKSCCGTAIA